MTATEVFLDQLPRQQRGARRHLVRRRAERRAPATRPTPRQKSGLNGCVGGAAPGPSSRHVRVIMIEPSAVATQAADHIAHGETKQGRAVSRGDHDHRRRHRGDHGPPSRPPRPRSVSLDEMPSSDPPCGSGSGRGSLPSLQLVASGVLDRCDGGRCGSGSPPRWRDVHHILLHFSRPDSCWNSSRRMFRSATPRFARPDHERADWTGTSRASKPPRSLPPRLQGDGPSATLREQEAVHAAAIAETAAPLAGQLRHDPARQPDLEQRAERHDA